MIQFDNRASSERSQKQSQSEIERDINTSVIGYESIDVDSQSPSSYPSFTVASGATHAFITIESEAGDIEDLAKPILRRLISSTEKADCDGNTTGVLMRNGESIMLAIEALSDKLSFANYEASKTNLVHVEYYKIDLSELD